MQVLSEPGSRLHVHLAAYQGVSLYASSSEMQGLLKKRPVDYELPKSVELLSGFVSYEQMADAMSGNSQGRKFLKRQEDTILSLRGPGMWNENLLIQLPYLQCLQCYLT